MAHMLATVSGLLVGQQRVVISKVDLVYLMMTVVSSGIEYLGFRVYIGVQV